MWVPEVLLVMLESSFAFEGIEVRTPYLDHRIVELAASLPPSWKMSWRMSKRFLRKVYGPRLPTWLSGSRREGAVKIPISPLLRAELRPWLEDYVLSPTARERGYFKPAAVRRLVEEHVQGRTDHGQKLWSLLMLELWHRRFHDIPTD